MKNTSRNKEFKSFYEELLKMIFGNTDDSLFRERLKKSLDQYQRMIRSLSLEDEIKVSLMKDIIHSCNKIKDVVFSYYKGLQGTAFSQMANLLKGQDVGKAIPIIKIDKGSVFYRIRELNRCDRSVQRDYGVNEMFHIPLSKRGIVQTQRYSMSGYPCLYAGKRLYTCWLEVGRPRLEDCMASALVNNFDIKLLDLSVPSYDKFIEDYPRYIKIFPLIIACSFKVFNDNVFIPEYIVPQLILEWLIVQNNKKTTLSFQNKNIGVYYTSVFSTVEENIYSNINIAVPVLNPLKSNELCSVLTNVFSISEPINFRTQLLLESGQIDKPLIALLEDKVRHAKIRQFS